MKKFARLAGFGALGVAVGVTALFLLIAIGGGHSSQSGIDSTQGLLVWVGAGIPTAAIVAAHIVYAVHLLRYAKENKG